MPEPTEALAAVEPWYLAGWSERITPSSMQRADACIRSEAMPHVQEDSEFAARGTIAHKFMADVLEQGVEAALSLVEDPEDVEWLTNIQLEKLPAFDPNAYAAEVALAYDPVSRTARELGRNLSRAQAHALSRPGEIVGIMDVLGASSSRAFVGDYKFGWGYVEPARLNWQLKTYALIACRYLRLPEAVFSVIRAKGGQTPYSDVAHMDEYELLMHEDALRALLARRDRVREFARAGRWAELPPFSEGRHCRYCPARKFCPVKTEAIRQLAGSQVPVLTPEVAAEAWRRYRLAKQTMLALETALREYARTQPLELGDGEILGEKLQAKETIVPERLRQVCERQWGPLGKALAGAAIEIEETATKARFERELKKLILPTLPPDEQKITWLKKDAYKLLREAGALSVTVERVVTEYTPSPVRKEEE